MPSPALTQHEFDELADEICNRLEQETQEWFRKCGVDCDGYQFGTYRLQAILCRYLGFPADASEHFKRMLLHIDPRLADSLAKEG